MSNGWPEGQHYVGASYNRSQPTYRSADLQVGLSMLHFCGNAKAMYSPEYAPPLTATTMNCRPSML